MGVDGGTAKLAYLNMGRTRFSRRISMLKMMRHALFGNESSSTKYANCHIGLMAGMGGKQPLRAAPVSRTILPCGFCSEFASHSWLSPDAVRASHRRPAFLS